MRLNIPRRKSFQAPANLLRRGLAFLVDLIVLDTLILFPLRNLIMGIVPLGTMSDNLQLFTQNPYAANLIFLIFLYASILSICYFTFLEYWFGQSIGKMLLGLHVVSSDGDLGFWRVLARNLFLLPVIPFILLWLIDPLWIIFSKENKRLSDVFVKANVVEQHHFEQSL